MEPDTYAVASWRDAEINAARWLRHWGYADAVARPDGPDGSVDVRATGAVGQVRYQLAKVGRCALHDLVDTYAGCSVDLFVFTGTSFSWDAVPFADERRIALFTFATDGKMTAVNSTARQVVLRSTVVQTAGALSGAQPSSGVGSADAPNATATRLRWPWTRRRDSSFERAQIDLRQELKSGSRRTQE